MPDAEGNGLGWRGTFGRNHPQIAALRATMEEEAGLPEAVLAPVDPAEPGFAQRAAELFRQNGFVVVLDVLDPARLEAIRAGCDRVVRAMLQQDPQRVGTRGSHRYSFGQAPSHFGELDAWSVLIDPPVLHDVLLQILGDDYVLAGCAARSLVDPGAGRSRWGW